MSICGCVGERVCQEGCDYARLQTVKAELLAALQRIENTWGHKFNNELADCVESALAHATQ